MSNLDQATSKSLLRSKPLGLLTATVIILGGFWLLDRLITDRAVQLLILAWIIAALACGIAIRSARRESHWWALPAWMLAGSTFCLLAGLLTLLS
jgi:hypothetical protein